MNLWTMTEGYITLVENFKLGSSSVFITCKVTCYHKPPYPKRLFPYPIFFFP
jgi:hypothetical protein